MVCVRSSKLATTLAVMTRNLGRSQAPGQLLQVVQRALHGGAQPAAARGVQEFRGQELVNGLLGADAVLASAAGLQGRSIRHPAHQRISAARHGPRLGKITSMQGVAVKWVGAPLLESHVHVLEGAAGVKQWSPLHGTLPCRARPSEAVGDTAAHRAGSSQLLWQRPQRGEPGSGGRRGRSAQVGQHIQRARQIARAHQQPQGLLRRGHALQQLRAQ